MSHPQVPHDGIRQLLNSDAKVLLFFDICKKKYKKMKIYLHNSKKSGNFDPIYTEYSCMSFKKVIARG